MSDLESSIKHTRTKRAETVWRDLPEDTVPALGEKHMCRHCERVFGHNDSVTLLIICRACIVGAEAERLFTGS